jgi:carboxymethylenebutenolidase
MVWVEARDGRGYDVYICGEEGRGRPALLIFTPVFGIDEDMKGIASDWAKLGYLVAVPDYFFRQKPGPLDRSEQGRAEAFARWENLDVDQAIDDTRPLVERLLRSPACNGSVGALGFCAGGELAFLAATRLGARAVAAFHATRIHRHLGEAPPMDARISLHYGDSDPLVPMSEVDQIRQRFKGMPNIDIAAYPGAGHGFSFRGRPSYDENAATRSRARAAEVLATLKDAVKAT